jgi:hypothetical protein
VLQRQRVAVDAELRVIILVLKASHRVPPSSAGRRRPSLILFVGCYIRKMGQTNEEHLTCHLRQVKP